MHTEKGMGKICIVLLILFMGLGFAQQPNNEKVLSVCDVLSNLDFYQGRTLAVKGIYNWSSHGWSGTCQ
jgi:hypothetical protein